MPLTEVKLKSSMDRLICLVLTALCLTPQCDAFFRNLMIGNTAMARIDPIVNRGEAAMHVHHLTGGGNLNFDSDGETLSRSTCTSSLLTQDKSAYWAPWMYFQHDNGTFVPVELALGLTAYYKYETRGNTGPNANYSVFPKGLKMLSGDTKKRTWTGPWPVPEESLWGDEDTTQEALQEKAMGFNCMNYQPNKNEPSFAYPYLRNKEFLDTNCINGVRAEIIFPSCWDGKNLDSSDHKSHVQFPTLIQDGVCPDTHPIYLPILFYETIWQTNAFKAFPGQFVMANGDPTGYGYHADFIAAWDDGVQEAVRDNTQCTALGTSGQIESCPVFQGHIQTQDEARSCKLTLPKSIANEETSGPLDSLPGRIAVQGSRHDPGDSSGSSPASSETYAPSSSIPATRSSALAAATNPVPASTGYYSSEVTNPALTTLATSYGLGTAAATSTTTYTSGKYIVEMVLIEMVETVTATTTPTSTALVPGHGYGPRSTRNKRHIHQHVHKHDHS